ncbi:MAG: hypothetical protein F6K17_10660 [Okeania sp. SIO3C4]|nr:hypothetical protein [Okeania sp. SIO3B3]NER03050.1 hypothetical protein [Okeania sp. SIO3C4]
MTSTLILEINFLVDYMARQPRQGLKSLANSLSHLKMTLELYAIFFIFLYCQDLRKLTFKPPFIGANGIRPRYM